MINLSLETRALGWLLGLGDLQREPSCHGYACGCRCAGCLERVERVSLAFLAWLERDDDDELVPAVRQEPRQARQPWELAA